MRSSIRRESFLALAAGEGGGAAIAELKAAQGIKNRVLLRAVVEVSPDRPNVAAAYAVLAEVEHLAPDVVNEIVSCPAVGMWLGRALRGAADPGRMAAVALAASHRAGEARELRVNSHEGWITLPSAGGFPSEGGCLVGVGPGGVTADGRPVRGWRAPAVVDLGDHGIAIDDLDAYRWNPDGEDRPRLDATESAAWRRLLPEAWALLTE